jgi:hypothetical protein
VSIAKSQTAHLPVRLSVVKNHATLIRVRLPTREDFHPITVITVTKLTSKTNSADVNPAELFTTVTKSARRSDGEPTKYSAMQYMH